MRAAIYILQQFSGFLNGYCLNTKNDLNYHCKKKKKKKKGRLQQTLLRDVLWSVVGFAAGLPVGVLFYRWSCHFYTFIFETSIVCKLV